jgi:DNA invertase Pin-like site-specific DNA recombinase
MATVAELEGGIISQRTRAALQAAKRRGVRLGGDRGNLPTVCRAGAAASVLVRQRKARERNADVLRRITAMRQEGMSVKAIAERLNEEHIPAPRGGRWAPEQRSADNGSIMMTTPTQALPASLSELIGTQIRIAAPLLAHVAVARTRH